MPGYFNPYNPNITQPYGGYYTTSYNGIAGPLNDLVYRGGQSGSFTTTPSILGMVWVEGEVGAKAYQMPAGWPVNQPIPLWDNTEMVIYLKSWNQMGIPNPLQKIQYSMVQQNEEPIQEKLNGMSGNSVPSQTIPAEQSNQTAPLPQYATKEDFEALRQEIRNLGRSNDGNAKAPRNVTYANNQNGTRNESKGGSQ